MGASGPPGEKHRTSPGTSTRQQRSSKVLGSSKFCRQNVLHARLTGFACFRGEKREREPRPADGSAANRADRAGTVDEADEAKKQ